MTLTIVDVHAYDIRFPTSRTLAGSDAMNNDPDYSQVAPFLKMNRMGWPQATNDSIEQLETRYRIHSFPTTLLIDPDGKIVSLGQTRKKQLDFRVNCLPTLWGEKIVLRLLDKENLRLDMTKLGFEPESLVKFQHGARWDGFATLCFQECYVATKASWPNLLFMR